MDHASIIAALGGYQAVAEELNTPPNIVWRWGRTRAIPPGRWQLLMAFARRLGRRDITLEALLQGYIPAQQQRAADLARMRQRKAARAAA
jgi:hypothetical protein